jgi:hypothetical protein
MAHKLPSIWSEGQPTIVAIIVLLCGSLGSANELKAYHDGEMMFSKALGNNRRLEAKCRIPPIEATRRLDKEAQRTGLTRYIDVEFFLVEANSTTKLWTYHAADGEDGDAPMSSLEVVDLVLDEDRTFVVTFLERNGVAPGIRVKVLAPAADGKLVEINQEDIPLVTDREISSKYMDWTRGVFVTGSLRANTLTISLPSDREFPAIYRLEHVNDRAVLRRTTPTRPRNGGSKNEAFPSERPRAASQPVP